MISAGYRI